jgi:SAM-dependent methyltransferase
MKLQIGGKPRDGWTTVGADIAPGVVRVNLGRQALPFDDLAFDAAYSSHVLQRVGGLDLLLREIVRVCKNGATFELRLPHWLSSMAHCPGQLHTISEQQVQHWCRDFPADWFPPRLCDRRLRLARVEKVPSGNFQRAREVFGPLPSDDDLLDFVPDACHEVAYYFEVILNELA